MAVRPVEVIICGQPFEISWDPRHGRKLHEDDPDYWGLGSTAVAEQRIVIRGVEQGVYQERETVLHEILHAVINMTAQRDRFAPIEGGDKDKASEPVVDAMATALLAVLRDNPQVVGWLTEEPLL